MSPLQNTNPPSRLVGARHKCAGWQHRHQPIAASDRPLPSAPQPNRVRVGSARAPQRLLYGLVYLRSSPPAVSGKSGVIRKARRIATCARPASASRPAPPGASRPLRCRSGASRRCGLRCFAGVLRSWLCHEPTIEVGNRPHRILAEPVSNVEGVPWEFRQSKRCPCRGARPTTRCRGPGWRLRQDPSRAPRSAPGTPSSRRPAPRR